MLKSLRGRLMLSLLGMVLLATAVLGWLAYSRARAILRDETTRALGMAPTPASEASCSGCAGRRAAPASSWNWRAWAAKMKGPPGAGKR